MSLTQNAAMSIECITLIYIKTKMMYIRQQDKFKDDEMSTGEAISKLIDKYTKDDVVDLHSVVTGYGGTIVNDFSDATLRGALTYDDDEPIFHLNKKNTKAEDKCTLALLFAKYLIQLGTLTFREHKVDAFLLQDIRQYRESPQIMLATHLAIPVNIITKVNDITFNSSAYALKADLTTYFINSTFNVSQVSGLLCLFNHLNIVNDGRSGRMRKPISL